MQDDRASNVGGEHDETEAAPPTQSAELRRLHLSARSLAARGDALDASEDGRRDEDEAEDGAEE